MRSNISKDELILKSKISELKDEIEDNKIVIENLNNKIKELRSTNNSEIEKYKQQITQLQEHIDDLEDIKINDVSENYDSDVRSQYDDSSSVLKFLSSNREQYMSLCIVNTYMLTEKRLIREADIDVSGRIEIFLRDESQEFKFGNRDKLYYNGPFKDGTVGVWSWSATPNYNDAEKDYIRSKYCEEITPIEICIFDRFSTLSELADAIKTGITCQLSCDRIMLSVKNDDEFIGISCNKKDFDINNDKITLKEYIFQLPVYAFSRDEIINIQSPIKTNIYNKIYCGLPKYVFSIKTKKEIVKTLVLDSISFNRYKQVGHLRADIRVFKDFINSIPTDDLISKISDSCRCNTQTASHLLQQFIDHAVEYVETETIDDEVIGAAIIGNESLMAKAAKIAEDKWKKDNQERVAEANEELSKLMTEIHNAENTLNKYSNEVSALETKQLSLTNSIADKKRLADDVEKSVSERINKAKANAAEFIATMAFINSSAPIRDNTTTHKVQYQLVSNTINEDLQIHSEWSDVVKTAREELESAGVSQKYSYGLALYLCSAFILKQPVLLVGPNAIDIVEAFSYALYGGKYGILNCRGDFSPDVTTDIGSEDEHIVVIKNIIESNWISYIPDIISKRDTMFFFIHPYAEDIQIEPKSIYNYMLPLFTEFFVSSSPRKKYFGGKFSDSFKGYSSFKDVATHRSKALSHIPASAVVKNNLTRIISIMYDIDPNLSTDDDVLFGAVQFAYATMNIPKLMNYVSNNNGIASKNLMRDLKDFLGEFDE